jgi:hypothetical protein
LFWSRQNSSFVLVSSLYQTGKPSDSLTGPTAVRWPVFLLMISPAATLTIAVMNARPTTSMTAARLDSMRGRR